MKLDAPKPVDDRGREIPAHALRHAAEDAATQRGIKGQIAPAVIVGIGVLILISNVAQYGIGTLAVNPRHFILPIASIGLFAFLNWLRRRRASQLAGGGPVLPIGAAWLAAHRFCGACGYDMKAAHPEADHCAVCPECGAAWHSDRWTREGLDPHAARFSIAMLLQRESEGWRRLDLDDRRLPLDKPIQFPPDWIGRVGQVTERAIRVGFLKDREQRWRKILLFTAVAMLAGFGCAVVATRGDIPVSALIGVLAAVIGLPIAIYLMQNNPMTRMKNACIAHALCPHCGHGLNVSKPQFDGCVPCEACGRAWKPATA